MKLVAATLGTILVLASVSPALAGGVAIVSTSLTDNGDGDGYADSQETVTLQLTVRNTSGIALTGVTARLAARDPEVACVTTPLVSIGDLAVGQQKTTTGGFVFTVSDVDRAALGLGAYDELATSFDVTIESLPEAQVAYPSVLTFDLDLDIVEGSGNTTFFEGFENGLGTFEVQNLDQGLSNLTASDGYRCPYNNPDYVNSNTYTVQGTADNCFVSVDTAHGDTEWWGISGPETSPAGGRGFSGFHSLFFGLDMGPPQNWTTPTGIIEAARTTDPINISRDAATPTLSIKQQVSLADFRAFALPQGLTYDRGVVGVQVADDTGAPAGPWVKIDAYQNPYDQQNHPGIINCGFDPIDDGNDEDDFFAPSDPNRRYGPSSTCFPAGIFANIGDTDEPFSAANIGLADGPGLQGLWGIGTWVESKFDLSRFRGQRIRLRFLASTVKAATATTWEDIFTFNPDPGDDGWWVDDVEITGALTTPATVAVDTKDNSALPAVQGDADLDDVPDVCDNCVGDANADQFDSDFDSVGDVCDLCTFDADNFDPDLDSVCGTADNCPFVSNPGQTDGDDDGFGAACDCNDAGSTIFPGAPEVNDGIDNNCPGDDGYGAVDEISGTFGFFNPGDKETLSWPGQDFAQRYQLARANDPGFDVNCNQFATLMTEFTDPVTPPPGGVSFYMVRPQLPNRGSWGNDSSGVERTVSCAP